MDSIVSKKRKTLELQVAAEERRMVREAVLQLPDKYRLFPDGRAGMCGSFDYSYSERGLADLLIDVYILNEDGTITFVAYRPKLEDF